MDEITKLLKAELIGRKLRLIRLSDNHTLNAKIIDETKNTVLVESSNTRKRIIKTRYAFEFEDGGKIIRVDGSYFQKRPEERIKTKLTKRW
jgi:RNase P/RNase MRP subunit p29